MKKLLIATLLMTTATAASAAWSYNPNTDPFNGYDTSTVVNREDTIASMCVLTLFSFEKYMGPDDAVMFLKVRVDNQMIEDLAGKWYNSFAVIPRDKQFKRITEQMKKGKRIYYRAEDFQGRVETRSVSLVGYTKAFNKLGCK